MYCGIGYCGIGYCIVLHISVWDIAILNIAILNIAILNIAVLDIAVLDIAILNIAILDIAVLDVVVFYVNITLLFLSNKSVLKVKCFCLENTLDNMGRSKAWIFVHSYNNISFVYPAWYFMRKAGVW